MAFAFLPWSVKIIYGLISDNIPLFGSKRKSYLLIMAILQSVTMVVLAMQDKESNDVTLVKYSLFLSNVGIAFSDVIVDSLMVIQARKDPEQGSEELSTFQWTFMAIGGLLGSVIAAVLTESDQSSLCFWLSAIMGVIIAVNALFLDSNVESDGLTEEELKEQKNATILSDMKRYITEMKEAFKLPEFRNVMLYLVVGGMLVPSFSAFSYYFMMDVIQLSKFTYSMLNVLGYICLMFGTSIFNKYFKDYEYRKLIMMDGLLTGLMAPFSMSLILRTNLNYGVPDIALIISSDIVHDITTQCFIFLPMQVIFAKITPKHIEATSFALLAGLSNFRGTMRSYLGTTINDKFVGVTQEDLTDYYKLASINLACSFLPLLFLWLIPTREQILAL